MNSIVEAVAAAAAQKPDTIAVIAEKQTITYSELWKETRGFAAYIRSLGLEKGERILVKSQHSIWYVVACFGVHLSGCVFSPVEATIGDEGLKEIAGELSASMVISNANIEGEHYIALNSSDVRSLAAENFDEAQEFDFPKSEELCDILFTTGTTGKSKGVMLTHKAVVAVIENFKYGVNVTPNNVFLIPAPINHGGGLRRIYLCMLTGTTAVLLNGFTGLKVFFEYIRDYHVTSVYMPPSAIRLVLLRGAQELVKYADQLDFIYTSSNALPEADRERLIELLPNTRLFQAYGATEAGAACIFDYSKEKEKLYSAGRPTVNSHVFIADENKREIKSSKDNPGYIATSGPLVMSGYYNDPELTKEVLVDGAVYSNDIGYIDEDGYLYVIGRRGDVINLGGLKIAPTEVENVVLRFPGIAECACFAVEDKVSGIAVKLNIVEEAGADVDIRDLHEHMLKNLEKYKIPNKIEKVQMIPKTENGKIDRKVLK